MTLLPSKVPSTYRLLRYETVGSTNDEAKRLARDGAEGGTLVWALEQTAGRGRQGRVWVSPRGNLYVSVILRPGCPVGRAAQLGFVAALAVGDALATIFPRLEGLSYKWPNDVLAGGRKLAGILLESELDEGQVPEFVIVGIGINLISSPRDTEFPATSIVEQGLGPVSAAYAIREFTRHFQAWVRRWSEEGFAPVRAAWRARAMSLGKPIRVQLEAATLHGRFLDIDQHGALLLETAGELRHISAGEIFPANR
ncbi:MAG TPA: biotin--[acetyl-CoA-carboxylase] ligase [Stellaceae bacterium]|nr:biotin--[acetyl-CoA-carboxylase] ligase [Stellaceae bacterium]